MAAPDDDYDTDVGSSNQARGAANPRGNVTGEMKGAPETRRKIGLAALKKVIILAIVLGVSLAVSTNLVWPFLFPNQTYLIFVQIAEAAIVGYFVIEVVSKATFKLIFRHSPQLAKTVTSVNRTIGAIIIVIISISYLSRDPVVAVSIGTVSGIVVGFASQNIIGNLIAGMYLVLARPFRIGDRISVFGQEGIVNNIELLYCKIITDNGDLMLTPNSSLVSTNIILRKAKT